MGLFIRGIAIALGLGASATSVLSTAANDDDPRVRAFVQAYGQLIDSVWYEGEDVVFAIGSEPIHFRDGRMLSKAGLAREAECDPIFYEYPLGPLTRPVGEPGELPNYCSDLLESLWGSTETEVRRHGRSVRFLDHRMFVNELLVGPLGLVERDIRNAARIDPSVGGWIEELEITYSFQYREIAGSGNLSQHSWGLAVDFVPTSYDGRAAYWRWSRALDRDGWHRIPMERRWSPPQRVVEIFERHGFIWGGKWAHFDAMHFEYRPEILLYSRLAEQ